MTKKSVRALGSSCLALSFSPFHQSSLDSSWSERVISLSILVQKASTPRFYIWFWPSGWKWFRSDFSTAFFRRFAWTYAATTPSTWSLEHISKVFFPIFSCSTDLALIKFRCKHGRFCSQYLEASCHQAALFRRQTENWRIVSKFEYNCHFSDMLTFTGSLCGQHAD